MAGLQSTRPYVVRDGAAWCAACTRRRLCRIVGTRYMACPSCDFGQRLQAGQVQVTITGGELLCSRCGANALVVPAPGKEAECPSCDTPPWEREQVAQPAVVQLLVPGTEDTPPVDGEVGGKNAPPRPASVVRGCFYCGQTTWHDHYWRLSRWRAICRGCGNRLSTSRAKSVRGDRRKGERL